MNRLLLYVHFNKYDALSGHVLYQLECMKPLFSRIIVISNSTLSKKDETKLHELEVSEILQRENKGYDFAAWRDGMNHVGFESLALYDSVTLMNDTCFGPLWDMEPIFTKFENRTDIDFWGMTNFRKTKYFKEHLQSYFLSFSKEVVMSQPFKKFWSAIENFESVQEVIDNYETQVTTNLIKAGYHYDAVFNTLSEDAGDLVHPDFSYYRPLDILEHKVPFLKVKAIKDNEKKTLVILRFLEKKSSYPISYIENYISRYISPDALAILDKKMLPLKFETPLLNARKAIHIHVDDIKTLPIFLEKKKDNIFYLFTVSRNIDAIKLETLLSAHFLNNSYQIVESKFSNHFHALFSVFNDLKDYDFIGHFHTSSLTSEGENVDNVIRYNLLNLLDYHDLVSQYFRKNKDVGLIFSDISLEQYMIEGITKLSEDEKLIISSELVKAYLPSLRIFGGFMWLSVKQLENIFEKRDLIRIGKSYSKELLEILLYLIFWDEDIDYRIINQDSVSYSWHSKLDMINVPVESDHRSIKEQLYNLFKTVTELIKKKGN